MTIKDSWKQKKLDFNAKPNLNADEEEGLKLTNEEHYKHAKSRLRTLKDEYKDVERTDAPSRLKDMDLQIIWQEIRKLKRAIKNYEEKHPKEKKITEPPDIKSDAEYKKWQKILKKKKNSIKTSYYPKWKRHTTYKTEKEKQGIEEEIKLIKKALREYEREHLIGRQQKLL